MSAKWVDLFGIDPDYGKPDDWSHVVREARVWRDQLRKYASGDNAAPMLQAADLLSEAAGVIERLEAS